VLDGLGTFSRVNKVTVDAVDGTATGWLTLYSVEDKDDMSDAPMLVNRLLTVLVVEVVQGHGLVSAPLVLCWSQMAAVVHPPKVFGLCPISSLACPVSNGH